MAAFTRDAINQILNDSKITPGEKTDRIFALHGQHLADGYISKSDAKAAQDAAVAAVAPPDPRESQEYKDIVRQLEEMRGKDAARKSADFRGVKEKFFDDVYARIDRSEGAAPIADQMATLRADYAEFFNAPAEDQQQPQPFVPQFGAQTQGEMPRGDEAKSFAAAWGFGKDRTQKE